MSDSADRYYQTLAADYARTIRQLVPRYDEMLETIAALVRVPAGHSPPGPPSPVPAPSGRGTADDRSVLDIGAGSGEVSALLLSRHPGMRITAIEPSTAMREVLRPRLAPWADRVRIEPADALGFAPGHRCDVVVTNLVLHNLGNRDKRKALRRILNTLVAGGVFVWGDMILRPDARVQRDVIADRTRHARAAGCPEAFIAENFRKEAEDDSPWTIHETLLALRRVGFRDVDCVWSAGGFAVFAVRRPGRKGRQESESLR